MINNLTRLDVQCHQVRHAGRRQGTVSKTGEGDRLHPAAHRLHQEDKRQDALRLPEMRVKPPSSR